MFFTKVRHVMMLPVSMSAYKHRCDLSGQGQLTDVHVLSSDEG